MGSYLYHPLLYGHEEPSEGQWVDSEASQNTPFHETRVLLNHPHKTQTMGMICEMQLLVYLPDGSCKQGKQGKTFEKYF